MEYRIGSGAWQAYTGPVTVSDEGTTKVHGRAKDAAGPLLGQGVRDRPPGLGRSRRWTCRVSRTGHVLSPAAKVSVTVESDDATSGVLNRTIKLDGKVSGSPVNVDAVALKVGRHTLVVTVVDRAGNTTTSTLSFTVKATYAGGVELVDRLETEGKVTGAQADNLRTLLETARVADEENRVSAARTALIQFSNASQSVTNTQARSALLALSKALRAEL